MFILVRCISCFKSFIVAGWRFVKLQELISQDNFVSIYAFMLLAQNYPKEGWENVNYNVFACVAEVNSKDQDELQSVGQT